MRCFPNPLACGWLSQVSRKQFPQSALDTFCKCDAGCKVLETDLNIPYFGNEITQCYLGIHPRRAAIEFRPGSGQRRVAVVEDFRYLRLRVFLSRVGGRREALVLLAVFILPHRRDFFARGRGSDRGLEGGRAKTGRSVASFGYVLSSAINIQGFKVPHQAVHMPCENVPVQGAESDFLEIRFHRIHLFASSRGETPAGPRIFKYRSETAFVIGRNDSMTNGAVM